LCYTHPGKDAQDEVDRYQRVRYELQVVGRPTLEEVLGEALR
jgi:hypothetical protein